MRSPWSVVSVCTLQVAFPPSLSQVFCLALGYTGSREKQYKWPDSLRRMNSRAANPHRDYVFINSTKNQKNKS